MEVLEIVDRFPQGQEFYLFSKAPRMALGATEHRGLFPLKQSGRK